jgi:hypothetical protein
MVERGGGLYYWGEGESVGMKEDPSLPFPSLILGAGLGVAANGKVLYF